MRLGFEVGSGKEEVFLGNGIGGWSEEGCHGGGVLGLLQWGGVLVC